MKKVGIITIYDLENYGNRLQNYAVFWVLKKMGLSAMTYTYKEQDVELSCMMYVKSFFHRATRFHFTSNEKDWEGRIQRRFRFKRFTDKFIPTKIVSSLEGLSKRADYFIVGSDQVWNPLWYEENTHQKKMYLLTFADSKQKVCFAPSFGISQIPNEWSDWFRNNLLTFPYLSVREEEGKKIIKKLTGREATVLIDPTLMLDADEWLKVARKPVRIETEYPFIITYFLGEIPKEAKKDIEEIQKQEKRKIYNLFDKNNSILFSCGPSEFIYMISKADIVFTNSFHACVFSFLFNRPFIVYDRVSGGGDMKSRIDTFLSMFSLERKYRNSGIENELFENDYSIGYKSLGQRRDEVLRFLYNSMRI